MIVWLLIKHPSSPSTTHPFYYASQAAGSPSFTNQLLSCSTLFQVSYSYHLDQLITTFSLFQVASSLAFHL